MAHGILLWGVPRCSILSQYVDLTVRGPTGGYLSLSRSRQADLPTKTPCASEPGHIPLKEIDSWTCFKIEIGKSLIDRSSCCRFNLLPPSMKRVAFQVFLIRSRSFSTDLETFYPRERAN